MTRFLKKSDDLKAGEYLFKPGVSMRQVMETLVDGKGIQHAITIPEGLTSQMIVDRLAADDCPHRRASAGAARRRDPSRHLQI